MTRRRRFGFRLVAVLVVPAVFVATVEAALRWSGTGYPATFLVAASGDPGYLADMLRWDQGSAPRGDWPSEEACAERLGLTPYYRLLVAQELKSRLATPVDRHRFFVKF